MGAYSNKIRQLIQYIILLIISCVLIVVYDGKIRVDRVTGTISTFLPSLFVLPQIIAILKPLFTVQWE